MGALDLGFSVESHAVVFARSGTRLSFQRFDARGLGFFRTAPPSLGALPCALRAGHVIVPLAWDEGMWIGCRRIDPDARQTVVVRSLDGSQIIRVDAKRGSALSVVGGFQCRGALIPFARHGTDTRLLMSIGAPGLHREWLRESIEIRLVSPPHFTRRTMRVVPPLDPAAQFGGHLLPKLCPA